MATLVDTGPLVALIDRGQDKHRVCTGVLPNLSAPLVSTWPCVTESMYFLASWPNQAALWRLIEDRRLDVHSPNEADVKRTMELMDKYHDIPMSLADASLVATAETRQLRSIFTLDSDFRIYRINDTNPFEVIP